MSSLPELKVTERDNTLNPRQLRSAGFVPATLYGKGVASQSIQVRAHEFTLAMMHGNREFRLQGLGSEVTARVQQLQVDPVKQTPLSVEFLLTSPVTGSASKKPASKKQPAEKPAPAAEEETQEEAGETVLTGA